MLSLRTVAVLLAPSSLAAPAVGQQARVAPVRRISPDSINAAYVEPALAADPYRPGVLIVAAMQILTADNRSWQVDVFRSADNGGRWTPVELERHEGECSGDPWLAWAGRDTVVLACLSEARSRPREPLVPSLFRSVDGGKSWHFLAMAYTAGSGASFDHPILGRRPDGSLLLAATQPIGAMEAFRVDPATGSLQRLVRFRPDSANNILGHALALGGDTTLLAFYRMAPDSRPLFVARASGGSVEPTVTLSRHITPWGFPALALDTAAVSPRHGYIYAGWEAATEGRGLDVLVASSDDRGATWSTPLAVTKQRPGLALRGRVALSVDQRGRLAVAWRDNADRGGRLCFDEFLAVSHDGGAHFSEPVRLSAEHACPETVTPDFVMRRWPQGGEYAGLAALSDGRFYVVWSDTRRGRPELWGTAVTVP